VPKQFDLPYRQIHLDFHTSPFIPDVGRDFNAREFADTMKRSHVNSVTVFAKCHHGHLYYNTSRAERHPGLSRKLNLLKEQVVALHKVGIRAPIYISVQCDEYAADTHPEWIARQPDGKPVGAGPFQPGWQILDMSSPYQEYLAEQTREVLKLFHPVDGIFFDMCWDQPSSSNYAVEGMLKQNLNLESESDQMLYANRVAQAYMKRFYQMVKRANRDATVYFNGRPYHKLDQDLPWQTQVEIEALPTGGWGYMYFSKNVRFARTFPRPYMGMTARFHKSWADFGGFKPYPALEYETSQMIAHGARCSIGDQLHPRGTLDPAAYDLIGRAYACIEEAEPYVRDAKPVAQIGLFQLPPDSANVGRTSGTDEGATRMLTQLKHQFDVVGPQSKLTNYELLILPDAIQLDEALIKKLRAYLKTGGQLLATGTSGLAPDATKLLLPELSIKPLGPSPFTTTYIRFGSEISGLSASSDHVVYEPGVRVTPIGKARSVASVVEPYFDRSWKHFSSHFQTPPDKLTKYSAAVLTKNTAYIPYPLFGLFARHGSAVYRQMLGDILDMLIDPLLQLDAPTSTEATVTRQRARTIVHLLNYFPERRTEKLDLIEDIVPLYDVPLSLRLPKPPERVYLAPTNEELDFDYSAGKTTLFVPELAGHQMIVFE